MSRIIGNLAFASKSMDLENVVGLLDSNRVAQGFYRELFEMVFDFPDLKDLDKLHRTVNYPAIDLGDSVARIAIQVTSDNSSKKIKETITKFIKNELYLEYDTLIIFIIGKKASYSTHFNTKSTFIFTPEENIWDDESLTQDINNIVDIGKLDDIDEFLETQLQPYKFPERLFEIDIQTSIEQIALGIQDILAEISNPKISAPNRQDDFIQRKNELNKLSWDSYRNRIQKHLKFSKVIQDFMRDPINEQSLKLYFNVTHSIQKYYLENIDTFGSFDELFREIFSRVPSNYDEDLNNQKIKIILHNMYFNCDIGKNPSAQAK